MARFRYPVSPEDRIRRLEADLYEARRTILDLMPEPIRDTLSGYYGCKSRQDTYAWESEAIDFVISQAKILSSQEGSYLSDRACCPLCGGETTSPYERGFSVPEGLRRHLSGWGSSPRCSVMNAALKLAGDCWDEKFSEAEEQEELAKQRRLAERRRTETLFRVDPTSAALLLDEFLGYGASPRNEEQLSWAEQRLESLGFRVSVEGQTKMYFDERPRHIVVADPRTIGHIGFRVYKKPLPKGRRVAGRSRSYRVFQMQDSWKHDIKAKYEKRVSESSS